MAFFTVCPLCGSRYRLLDKYRDRKVVCDDCKRPFLAELATAPEHEVPAGLPDRLPARGWLVVCPACAHAELVAEGAAGDPHCSQCDSPLARPVVASKKVRRRKGPRLRRVDPEAADTPAKPSRPEED